MDPIPAVPLKSALDYLAPDGSEIRLLSQGRKAGFCHCTLPAGQTSAAVRHRNVEELWFVLEGRGQVWREAAGTPAVIDVASGTSLVIPPKSGFQFRAAASAPLKILIATIPLWPGKDEAEPVEGIWR
jgi:mannose-6-phosphate isomerase-like protein (cupin superfamily)